jgi:hypothetical protein
MSLKGSSLFFAFYRMNYIISSSIFQVCKLFFTLDKFSKVSSKSGNG